MELASGLVNTSYKVGSALCLAIIVAISAAKTNTIKIMGTPDVTALNSGFQAAFFVAAMVGIITTTIAAVSIKSPRQ